MPLKHLFIDAALAGGTVVNMPKSLQHRMAHVLRLGAGDKVALFNGKNGLWEAELTDKACKSAQLGAQLQIQPAASSLTLVLGLPKREAWESALRQATELGVSTIQPLATHYAQRGHFNPERAQTLLIEAAEQSEHLALPKILPTRTLEDWLKNLKEPCIWGHARGQARDEKASKTPATIVLVGPEGGFSPAEEALLAAHPHVTAWHLPSGILRTDTAVVAMLTAALLGSA